MQSPNLMQLFGKAEQLHRYVSRRQQKKQHTAGIKQLLQIKKLDP